ncbi:hypothetical protein Bbelb_320490 [Branchiostoma belcheri]|nr:hypothetical protein Bbelb_320490 [Branchiostoma belcheri]
MATDIFAYSPSRDKLGASAFCVIARRGRSHTSRPPPTPRIFTPEIRLKGPCRVVPGLFWALSGPAGHPAATGLFLGPAGTRQEFNSDLNSTRAPLTKRRRDLIVRTPRCTPPVADSPQRHICYVTDQMNRIKPMPARLLSPTGAGRGYIPDGHRGLYMNTSVRVRVITWPAELASSPGLVCSMDSDCALARGEGWCCAPWNPWTVYEVSVCKPPGSAGAPCLLSRTDTRSPRSQQALERQFWRCPCKHGLVCVPEGSGLVGTCQQPPADYIV